MKRTTIKDVAKKAGVSIATVSFVLNNHPGEVISEKVKKRVMRVAQQLDYHPSAAAAGLARKHTRNIGIVFYRDPEIVSNQFYSFVIEGVIQETIARDYNLLFSYVGEEYKGYATLPKIVREKNVEGVVFVRELPPKMVEDIQARGIPVVAVDNFPPMAKLDSVQIDSERGGELAAEHLLSLGHRDALLLGAALDRPSIRERCEGFMRVFLAGGGSFDKRKHLIKCEHTYHSGRDHALESLKRFPSTTAIFCVNDEMAAGALYAVLSLGLRVPKDVSIVGFDDVILSRYTSPGLTTIGLYKQELGRRAIQRLLTLVEAKHTESKKHDVKQEKVEVELVVRESTGPVKALPSTIAKPRARRKAKARAS